MYFVCEAKFIPNHIHLSQLAYPSKKGNRYLLQFKLASEQIIQICSD